MIKIDLQFSEAEELRAVAVVEAVPLQRASLSYQAEAKLSLKAN